MKLEINNRRKTGIFTNMWLLTAHFQITRGSKKKLKGKFKKKSSSKNKHATYQNLGNDAKATIKVKFIMINAHIKKKIYFK